jgi:hypothetical protein
VGLDGLRGRGVGLRGLRVVLELGRGMDMDVWVSDGEGWRGTGGMIWGIRVFARELVEYVCELVGR